MKIANKDLLDNPGRLFEIDNDDDARCFLLEVGLLGRFVYDNSPSRTRLVTYDEHQTHFVVVLYFTGMASKSDNGYLIYCLPKSRLTPELANAFIENIAIAHDCQRTMRPLKSRKD
jgi:hypothetical protein